MPTAEEIRQRMATIRSEIDQDVEELVDGAKSLVDWREYVKSYPLLATGLAMAAGYALIPNKKPQLSTDPTEIARLIKENQVNVSVGHREPKKGSMFSAMIGSVGGMAVRLAISQIGAGLSASFAQSLENQQRSTDMRARRERTSS